MKNTPTNKTINQIREMSISLKEFDKRFSPQEKRAIDQETKYLEVLASLRASRKKAGLSQKELAERSNIPRATITKIENGQRNATLKTLLSLGEAMGKTMWVQWV